jgi:hypothetical protein
MTEALATQSKEIQQWTSPAHIKERITAIQKLMKDVLRPGTKDNDWSGDYGIVPGTKKPSLWKSGSEQILAMFQIAVDPVVEDLSVDDCYRYRVTTRLTNSRTGEFLGAGVGEASTDETKYKWRRTYSKPEYEASDPDRRRKKYGQYKGNDGKWVDTEEMQVRQEPADLANTVLKMAKKRSQIDATLTVTGASSMFEQDLEDLPEETQRELLGQRKRGKKPEVTGDVLCNECRAINGHLPSCPHRTQAQGATAVAPQTQAAPATAQTVPAASKALETMLLQVLAVATKRRKTPKGTQEYRVLTVMDREGLQWTLFAWDKKHYEFLDPIPAKTNCIFDVKRSKSGDQEHISIEHIVETGGLRFANDLPVVAGEVVQDAPAQEDIPW